MQAMTTTDPIRAALEALSIRPDDNRDDNARILAAIKILKAAATPSAPSVEVREKEAQKLQDRFIERGNARITGSMFPVGTNINEIVHSYRDDFLKDADALLSSGLLAPAHEGLNEAVAASVDVILKWWADNHPPVMKRVPILEKAIAEILEGTRSLHRGAKESDGGIAPLATDPKLLELIERAKTHVMTPGEIHEQRRSFARGMCPSHRDYTEWCTQVDKLMPPLDAGRRALAEQEEKNEQ